VHAFFIFSPVLSLPLANNLILFDSRYFVIHEVLHRKLHDALVGRFGSWGFKSIFGGRVNQLTHSDHEYSPRLSSVCGLPLSHYVCVHAIIWLLIDNQCRS